jgi:hypothetical protein
MPETVVGKDQAAYIEGLVCPSLLLPIRLKHSPLQQILDSNPYSLCNMFLMQVFEFLSVWMMIFRTEVNFLIPVGNL